MRKTDPAKNKRHAESPTTASFGLLSRVEEKGDPDGYPSDVAFLRPSETNDP